LKEFEINGAIVQTSIEKMNRNTAEWILNELNARSEFPVVKITVELNSDGNYGIDYELKPPKFERIRRITGYLVGTMDRWNNSKRAEESERIKHA